MTRTHAKWTLPQIKVLRENYAEMTAKELARLIPHTPAAIYARAAAMMLKKHAISLRMKVCAAHRRTSF